MSDAFDKAALRDAARSVLDSEVTPTKVRDHLLHSGPWRSVLHEKLAELNWYGLLVPTEFSGLGAKVSDAVVVLEELGRVAAPSAVLSSMLATAVIDWAGDDAQKNRYLSSLASGEVVGTVVADHRPARRDVAVDLITEEEQCGVSGEVAFVPDALSADVFVVPVTRPRSHGGPELRFVVLERSDDGIDVAGSPAIGVDELGTVRIEAVHVNADRILWAESGSVAVMEDMRSLAAVGMAAQMAGGTQMALDLSVAFAREREQSGKAVATFSPVQDLCVELFGLVGATRAAVERAARAFDVRHPSRHRLASVAKAWANEAFMNATENAHRIHGAIGFSHEHPLHHLTRAALVQRSLYGDTAEHSARAISTSLLQED